MESASVNNSNKSFVEGSSVCLICENFRRNIVIGLFFGPVKKKFFVIPDDEIIPSYKG